MWQRHFEAILASDTLAFPLGDLLEAFLSHLLKLREHIH
jgi:hypothetical protein